MQSSFVSFDASVQYRNFPLKSCTAITAKMNWNSMYTIIMLNTFFREFTTQSNTACKKKVIMQTAQNNDRAVG